MTTFADTKMHHATRAKAEKIAATLAVELPFVTFEPNGDEIDHDQFEYELTGWTVYYGGEEVGELGAKDLDLDTIVETVKDAGFDPHADPETGEEPEEDYCRSSVDAKYKVLYAEVSENGRNCGDWLASFINGQCLVGKGKSEVLDVNRFADLLRNNGIQPETQKWGSAFALGDGARGWQGRFRMSGRVVLEKIVCQNGGAVVGADGGTYQLPADELARLEAKHSKALAKLRKGNSTEEKQGA